MRALLFPPHQLDPPPINVHNFCFEVDAAPKAGCEGAGEKHNSSRSGGAASRVNPLSSELGKLGNTCVHPISNYRGSPALPSHGIKTR